MIYQDLLPTIYEHAASSPFREVCGVVSTRGVVYPIENVSGNPSDFIFSKRDYAKAVAAVARDNDTIKCIYHSHWNGDPTPSKADREACARVGIDYLIVAGNKFTYLEHR
jgi:proteasome lid subunit RPN8/RPN11